jgi:hypothetical protein
MLQPLGVDAEQHHLTSIGIEALIRASHLISLRGMDEPHLLKAKAKSGDAINAARLGRRPVIGKGEMEQRL